MALKLPTKIFYTLSDLQVCWQVDHSDLHQWLTRGHLKGHVWLPVMSVFIPASHHSEKQEPLELRHWEGYIPISRHHCYRLFRQGLVRLREFTNIDHSKAFILPDTADDISVTLDELVVLEGERKRFEGEHGLKKRALGNREDESDALIRQNFDPSFKTVRWNGQFHEFGSLQSNVLRLLYEAALDGEPWQHGQRLLQKAGSTDYILGNLFKRKLVWQELITSDERGYYRMNEEFVKLLGIKGQCGH